MWAVFGGARDFGFVLWDDDHNLQQNQHLGGMTWENLRWMFTDTAYSRRYLPLTWLGWNVEHGLFGLTARSAHLGNILFHLLNTFLVFFVIKTAARIWLAGKNPPGPLAANAGAALGALDLAAVELVRRVEDALAQREAQREVFQVERRGQHHRVRDAVEHQRHRHLLGQPVMLGAQHAAVLRVDLRGADAGRLQRCVQRLHLATASAARACASKASCSRLKSA